MSDDRPPWERAEKQLNESSARDAANYESKLAKFGAVVLRDDASKADIEFYDAAIFQWTVMQMIELQRTDLAKRALATGTGKPKTTEPRKDLLQLGRRLLEIARERCADPGAAPNNIEMYERLVGMRRFQDVCDMARLRMIDAAKAAGAGTDW
jgi:hypothetical protein